MCHLNRYKKWILSTNLDNIHFFMQNDLPALSDIKVLAEHYELRQSCFDLPDFTNPNLGIGDPAQVVFQGRWKELKLFKFGLIRPGTTSTPVLNVRPEGRKNQNDDWNFREMMDIVNDSIYLPYGMKKRCIVVADAMIINEDIQRPFLVYPRDKKRPFSLAGICDPETETFALVEIYGNALFQWLDQSRSPVVMGKRDERAWLEDRASIGIYKYLHPINYTQLNPYPISPTVSDQTIKDLKILNPVAPKLLEEMRERSERESRERKIAKEKADLEESNRRYHAHQEHLRAKGLIPQSFLDINST